MSRQISIVATSIAALLAACGGSGSSGSPGGPPTTSTAQITRGAITAASVGSVTVNGVAFSTSPATAVRIEKVQRPESELRRGMVVRVKGNHANRVGQAAEIEFEDHVKGRVRSLNTTPTSTSVDVGGRLVHIEDSTHLVDDRGVDLTASDIARDDRLRVSGFADDQGRLHATSVERQGRASADDSFEAKGYVKGLNAGRTQFTLAATPSDATGISVTLGAGVALAAAIVEGSFVEVHSASALSAGAVTATSVTAEDQRGAEGEETEIEGIVTSGTSADFVVAGQRVTTGTSTRWEFGTAADFALGIKVEADGHIDASGTLVADKVSFRYDVKIEAPVASVGSSSLTVLGLPVSFSELTRLENTPVDGSTFEIRGFARRNAAGDVTGIVATRIRARSGGGGGGGARYLWQGPVDAVGGTSTVTILGVVVTTTGAAFHDHKQSETDPDIVITRDAFFAKVAAGSSVVKARLNAAPAGAPLSAPADELEVEDEPIGHK